MRALFSDGPNGRISIRNEAISFGSKQNRKAPPTGKTQEESFGYSQTKRLHTKQE